MMARSGFKPNDPLNLWSRDLPTELSGASIQIALTITQDYQYFVTGPLGYEIMTSYYLHLHTNYCTCIPFNEVKTNTVREGRHTHFAW